MHRRCDEGELLVTIAQQQMARNMCTIRQSCSYPSSLHFPPQDPSHTTRCAKRTDALANPPYAAACSKPLHRAQRSAKRTVKCGACSEPSPLWPFIKPSEFVSELTRHPALLRDATKSEEFGSSSWIFTTTSESTRDLSNRTSP